MTLAKATLRGAGDTVKALRAAHARAKKAEETAVRVRGFKLMQRLRRELRAGAPGGKPLAPLSTMRRVQKGFRSATGRLSSAKPLSALARSVGYEDKRTPHLAVRIGFGLARVEALRSATWRRLAEMHQKGFTTPVTARPYRGLRDTVEQYLRWIGSRESEAVFGGRKAARRKVFFLRKSTRELRTPARPIIDPFWAAHREDALRKIRRDFVRKMRGERI